jgi:hypothetical protein
MSNAKGLNEVAIKNLFVQFSSVINSRDPYTIRKFLAYYTDDAAQFFYKRMLKNAVTGAEEEEVTKMDKEAYTNYIIHIASDPIAYSFILNVNSIEIADNKLTAIVSMHINEMALVSEGQGPIESNSPSQASSRNIKAVVSTNCNFALAMAGSNPVLTSGNCIEKLVFG